LKKTRTAVKKRTMGVIVWAGERRDQERWSARAGERYSRVSWEEGEWTGRGEVGEGCGVKRVQFAGCLGPVQ